ncbi:hypothetical protein V5O48_011023 [Marasmius crinis-equi]|uniref:GPI anchored protein n=1 Tax=Marasmius crinis-equi TaxID=585013 RepID=A0ABR3F6U2_9AGAR
MKTTILGLLSLVPLLAQATDITLVQFVPASEATGVLVSTETSIAAVPIGTNGAETTYLIDVGDFTEITTTVDGNPTTTTSLITNTIVVSASGYKGQSLGGYDIDCHYTGDKAGECIYVVRDSTTTQTATFSGTPIELVVHVSDKAGGASETSGGSGSSPTSSNPTSSNPTSPTSSSPSGNSTSGNSTSNDKNDAMGMLPKGMGAMALGGFVLGALAVF